MAALVFALAACSSTVDQVSGPRLNPNGAASFAVTASGPDVVISQLYGGGGNSGASIKNDFIELLNRSGQPVNVTGWSVQYASAAGTTWAVTPLSGTIPPGGYYLVQEAVGAGGTVALAPDATGSIAMSATAGKVAVVAATTALSGTCPTASAIDLVSFGSTGCSPQTTPTLTNTTAALRGSSGCKYTGDLTADFATGAPAPRNSATAANVCAAVVPAGPLDHVVIAGAATVNAGNTIQLTATGQDQTNKAVTSAVITWTSSDPSIATVDAAGKVTGVAANPTAVTITATATDNGITKTATQAVTVIAPGIGFITVSSSSTSFPPGFQTQIFFTALTQQTGGSVVPATFTFEALNPELATITNVNGTGIVTAVAAPADGVTKPGFKITATPVGGGTPFSFTTHPITIEAPTSAPATIYAKNDEFGDPTLASTSNPNDLLIVRPQYTLSYNESRGTPNWVSYELDARQMVAGQDRCNCFTADPNLPADKQILTSDYTNGGFDRGHMTRSADRTASNVENATTFYLTNVVPQQADLNQGVWAQFENALADSARAGRAVYIVTGPLYSRSHALTFIKNEGKVAIPDSTWKVAFIGPINGGVPFTHNGLQTLTDVQGITLLAVNMPNVAGVRNNPWAMYLTTVDKIEAATGLDFLSVLPAQLQAVLESNDRPPTASLVAAVSGNEGVRIAFDASASSDPDAGDALSYDWVFGDGTTATTTDPRPTHVFADNGTYTVKLTVRDAAGATSTATATVTVANVAPVMAFSAPQSVGEGSPIQISLAGQSDAAADVASGLGLAVDCGDGAGYMNIAIGTTTASCATSDNGTRAIRAKITDKDGGTTEYTQTVTIANVAPTMSFTATPTVDEGSSIQLTMSSPADASPADVAAGLKVAVDCGAGAGYVEVPVSNPIFCPTTDNGTRAVRAKITDKDGGVSEYTRTVTIANVAPTVTITFTTPMTTVSGLGVGVLGKFTDPGADSPWAYSFDWADGTPQTGTLTTSGASVIGLHRYLAAGQYSVAFAVTDKDGATTTRLLTVTVNRAPIDGDANPDNIKLNDNGNGNISIRLSSPAIDERTIDVESVRIGTVAPNKDNIEHGGQRLSLDFSRKALIAAGMLTANTTELVLTANLTSGVQVVSHIPVSVH
ncbi:MAG: non-specific endonuclease [Gemmatimonadetes bacterium]|nr:non-specific endonuclease [Gemmatimonadota bacterium]